MCPTSSSLCIHGLCMYNQNPSGSGQGLTTCTHARIPWAYNVHAGGREDGLHSPTLAPSSCLTHTHRGGVQGLYGLNCAPEVDEEALMPSTQNMTGSRKNTFKDRTVKTRSSARTLTRHDLAPL